MVKDTLFDPFAMWKNMYEKTEENWNEVLQETMKKESFSKDLGSVLNYYLSYQEIVKKMTEDYLKQVNVPTRGEIADVASLIINIEEKVEDLDEKLEDEIQKVDQSRQISQLRRSVTNLEKKMDQIIELLEKQPQPVAKKAEEQKSVK